MKRARKLIEDARQRFLGRPGNEDFETRYFRDAIRKAADCYFHHGHEERAPEDWPFPYSQWRGTWVRKNQLTKAGVLYLAAANTDPSDESKKAYIACIRELEACLPPLPPSRPCPEREGWEDILFDEQTLHSQGYSGNRGTLAAVLGMHPAHLKPDPKLRIEHEEGLAEILVRLKIPFEYAPVEKGKERPQPGEHGIVGYQVDRRKSAVRTGELQNFILWVGYTTDPSGTLLAFFPDRGWLEASFDFMAITSFEVQLKAKEKPWACEVWKFHIPSSSLATDEQPP